MGDFMISVVSLNRKRTIYIYTHTQVTLKMTDKVLWLKFLFNFYYICVSVLFLNIKCVRNNDNGILHNKKEKKNKIQWHKLWTRPQYAEGLKIKKK